MKQLLGRFVLLSSLACLTALFPSMRAARADAAAARIDALEGGMAALQKEVAALRHENAALRARARPPANGGVAHDRPGAQAARTIDPRQAYAAVPAGAAKAVLKAPPPPIKGQFTGWVEGGGFWTGGDPIYSFYLLQPLFLGDQPRSFTLRPRFGWEAAIGFDYRFAGSPWHVSAQFRYGEARSSAADAVRSSFSLPPGFFSRAQDITADHKETHWLADFAVGRDLLGSSSHAMQVKLGLRIAEVTARTRRVDRDTQFTDFGGPVVIDGVTTTTLTVSTERDEQQRSTFRGAGPRIGVDGAAPLAPGWSFDYLADGAVLFGTHKFERTSTATTVSIPTIPVLAFPPTSDFSSRGGTVFNADLQAGVSYWITPYVKLSASYRLDAYFGVLSTLSVENNPNRLTKIDRYFHGPRVAVSGSF